MASDHVSSDLVPQCPITTLEQDSLSPGPQSQENVPQAVGTLTTSNELDLLFNPTQAPTVTSTENINQAETITENAQVEDDEFINIFCTPVQERGETSSQQVIGNPSQSVRTRRQLESDSEMCMFALTVSRTEPKNIKEAMTNSAWIESMQEELHQFDRLDIHQSPRDIFINQAKYAQEILIKHGMTSCDSIGTPMDTKHLDADLSGTPVDQTKYRSMVGALIYLTASMSSAKAEYVSLSACCAQVLWLRTQLTDYG
nr:hypothetical protein [Tanacetum cinerariifolium]